MTLAQRATAVLWIACLALTGLALWASLAAGRAYDLGIFALSIVTALAPLTSGWLAIRHAPGNWVGVWLTAAGAAILLQNAHGTWQEALALDPAALPASEHFYALTQGVWMAWFVPYALVIALFPDGRPFGRLGRLSVTGLVAIPIAFNLLTAVAPEPLMPPLDHWPHPFGTHPIGYAAIALLPLFLACLIGAAVSLSQRHRATTDPALRTQIRWLLLASGTVPTALLLCWVGYLVVGNPGPVLLGLVAMNVLIPAATLIAMLRHDLYDVDRAIVLAAVYSVLALGLLLGYAGLSAFLGRQLGQDSATAAVLATVGVMLALLPGRRLLLRLLGRWLHPRREKGLSAIQALSDRVSRGTDAPERLEEVLREALHDPRLRVGYRRPGEVRCVDGRGGAIDPTSGRPIRSRGYEIGVILSGPGSAAVPDEVAAACVLLADSVRLRGELAGALAEAEASRTRLLRASDDERRRLERDLHDGAQQRLVSLGMKLRIAQRQVRQGASVDVDALVDESVTAIMEAVGELRGIAQGLRPSSLDEGLQAALDNLARSSALPVELRGGVPELPDHVGLTAYYVASEAVTNATKHALASALTIEVGHGEGTVRVRVHDDGRGGATIRPGAGLARLRDRVEAVGGSLEIQSVPERGTTIAAVIPSGS